VDVVEGLEYLISEERLRAGFESMGKRRLSGIL